MLPGMEPTARLTVLLSGVPAERDEGARNASASARLRRSGRVEGLAFMEDTTISCNFDCCISAGWV